MENGNIREVVLGFKRMVDNIPTVYDNFEDALDKLFEGFYLTMEELLPLKYFALYEDMYGYEVAVFDSQEDCGKWIGKFVNSCDVSCSEITFSKFVELSHSEWSNPNCYYDEPTNILVFKL